MRRTHGADGSDSSRTFQTSARTPPGFSTRAISRNAGDGANFGEVARQTRQHRGDRFDRHDGGAGAEEARHELAGPGTEIDDRPAVPETHWTAEPCVERRRVVGSAAGVTVGVRHEAARGHVVDRNHSLTSLS